MTDLKALRALCDAATDGQRKYKADLGYDYGSYVYRIPSLCMNISKEDDARFIAATDPQTVRALIDEIEKLRSEVDRWRLEVEALELERLQAERN